MIVLAIDASTYVGTVAVFDESRLLAAGETAMRGRDSERLMPLVVDMLGRARVGAAQVARVVCGSGPGSFTSLRIAASIAKGFAVGRRIELAPVSSLALIVAANAEAAGDQRYVAVLDALRGESYVQTLAVNGAGVRSLDEPRLVRREALRSVADSHAAELVGPGMERDWHPHAKGALRLAPRAVADLAGWEPDYGRKAEAQSRWETEHGRTLPT